MLFRSIVISEPSEVKRYQYQYSDLVAVPVKVAYFLKAALIAPIKSIDSSSVLLQEYFA